MRIAAYIRVSTEKQVREGNGLDEQRYSITEYCSQHGHEVVAWYEDAGVSGGEVELREAMVDLLGDAKNRQRDFEAVVSTKLDRLARSLYGQLFVEKELAVAGVGLLYSEQETLAGTDPMTTAFRQIMGVFAELEKNLIKARMTNGRLTKARKGGYAGGVAALGYRAEKGSKALHVDPGKVETVRRVFELRDVWPEWSLRAIADELNREGHLTAQGKEFKPMQVKRVLDRRELYAGQYTYAGVSAEGKHQAIIGGEECWTAC